MTEIELEKELLGLREQIHQLTSWIALLAKAVVHNSTTLSPQQKTDVLIQLARAKEVGELSQTTLDEMRALLGG